MLESLFFEIDLSNFQFTLKRGINIYIMNPRNCFEFNSAWFWGYQETNVEPSQTSKIKFFAKIVNGFQLITVFPKTSILDIWLRSECAFAIHYRKKLWYIMNAKTIANCGYINYNINNYNFCYSGWNYVGLSI